MTMKRERKGNNKKAETFPPHEKEVIKMKRKRSAVGSRERSPPTQGAIKYDGETVFN